MYVQKIGRVLGQCICYIKHEVRKNISNLRLLVANLANMKEIDAKNLKKNLKPWQMGTHLTVLRKSFQMNTNLTV